MAKKMMLRECPTGLFKFGRTLCFKSEYGNNEGRIDAYIVSSGEFFWGGAKTPRHQAALMVTPVKQRADAATKAERAVIDAAERYYDFGVSSPLLDAVAALRHGRDMQKLKARSAK